MDLRSQYPRSPRALLGGYVHLARMIDKCRAVQAGTEGDYIFPCPMDQALLDFIGVQAEEFAKSVRGKDEQQIIQWLSIHSTSHSLEEIAQWNEALLTRAPDSEEKLAYFTQCLEKVSPTRIDIRTWADLLDIEEGRSVPIRSSA